MCVCASREYVYRYVYSSDHEGKLSCFDAIFVVCLNDSHFFARCNLWLRFYKLREWDAIASVARFLRMPF